MFFVLCQGAVR
jgi:hypothetical protein